MNFRSRILRTGIEQCPKEGRFMSCPRTMGFFAVLAVLALSTTTVGAATCTVPSVSHESIQVAVDDIGCTEIDLAAQIFIESVSITRSVVLRGQSSATTVIQGQLTVTGASIEVDLHTLSIDGSAIPVKGCFEVVLDVGSGGAVVADDDVVVINTRADGCPIFGDGLETGDFLRWSRIVGS